MEQRKYLISDAAKQVQVESHVLRYWEEELELPIQRNKLGHRYYTTEDVNRLKQIKSMKEQGFQLKAIKNTLKKEMEKGEETEKREKREKAVEKEEKKAEKKPYAIEVVPVVSGKRYETEVSDREGIENDNKVLRLQMLLKNLMKEAVQEGNEELCDNIRDSVLKELDYQFRLQEEKEEARESERFKREEAHYKQIDELLRNKFPKKEKRKKHSIF